MQYLATFFHLAIKAWQMPTSNAFSAMQWPRSNTFFHQKILKYTLISTATLWLNKASIVSPVIKLEQWRTEYFSDLLHVPHYLRNGTIKQSPALPGSHHKRTAVIFPSFGDLATEQTYHSSKDLYWVKGSPCWYKQNLVRSNNTLQLTTQMSSWLHW